MKKLLLIFLCYFVVTANKPASKDAPLDLKADTVITNKVYTSFYSFAAKNPLYITYKLYNGGGDCNRSQFRFTNEKDKRFSSSNDYYMKGFDEGHLANAEDFAGDCEKMGLTFKFYNCLPQTPNLNRGIWKHYETEIRKYSAHDSLLVICGGIFYGDHVENGNMMVPTYCFKIVKSLSTGKIVYSLLFTNDEQSNSVKTMPPADLVKMTKYPIKL